MKKKKLPSDQQLANAYVETVRDLDESIRENEQSLPPVVISLVDMLRLMNPEEKKNVREMILAQVQDMALAQTLIIMHTAKSDSTKLEAANSLMDRLNLPRGSMQYSKSEQTKVSHKDIINIMNEPVEKK